MVKKIWNVKGKQKIESNMKEKNEKFETKMVKYENRIKHEGLKGSF